MTSETMAQGRGAPEGRQRALEPAGHRGDLGWFGVPTSPGMTRAYYSGFCAAASFGGGKDALRNAPGTHEAPRRAPTLL